MIAWLVYSVLIASLVGLAAWVAEAALRGLHRPTRWVWLGAMAASVLVPLLARLGVAAPRLLPVLPPLLVGSREAGLGVAGGAGARSGAGGLLGLLGLTPGAALSPGLVIGVLWALGSLAVLAVLAVAVLRLRRARRGWRTGALHGVRVLVSDDAGPAVAGWLRGVIVVPAWALGLERRLQRLMLVHEGEHLRAGDPTALLAGLLVLAAAPWNPALWWQLRRLRQAVEADCDGRVLAARDDLRGYGRLLLEVGRRASPGLALATSLSEPRSFLERRIEIMTERLRHAPSRRRALVLGTGALLVLGVAFCSGGPESMVKPKGEQAASSVPANVAAQPTFTPFTVAPDLTNRQVVEKALETDYPPLLRDAGIGGTVFVWFFIDAQGKVGKAVIKASSGHAPLDSAALHVARLMTFSPAMNRDQPVPVWVALPIVFKTAGTNAPTAQGDTVRIAPPGSRLSPMDGMPVVRPGKTGDGQMATGNGSSGDRMPGSAPATPRAPATMKQLESRPTFTPYTVAPDLINREAVQKALEADYPPLLRDAGIDGTVSVWFFIDSHGKVVKAVVRKSSGHPALDQAAIKVAQTMVFSPAQNRGNPVAVWVALPIVFKR